MIKMSRVYYPPEVEAIHSNTVVSIDSQIIAMAQTNGIRVWPRTAVNNGCCWELTYDESRPGRRKWIQLLVGLHLTLTYNLPGYGVRYEPPFDFKDEGKVVASIVGIMRDAPS